MNRYRTKRKRNSFRKTSKKYKGGIRNTTQHIFNTAIAKDAELAKLTPAQKEKILEAIETFVADKNVQIIDTGNAVGPKINRIVDSMTDSINGSLEKIADWLLPIKTGKKNTTKVSLYFYPSLVTSSIKNDKPDVKMGSIMLKINNNYADISSRISSMFRQTDDLLANMRRGVNHPAKQKAFRTNSFTVHEVLDDNWKLNSKATAPPQP